MEKVLWLHQSSFSTKQAHIVKNFLKRKNITNGGVFFQSLSKGVKGLLVHKGKKWVVNEHKRQHALRFVTHLLERVRPTLIVINDDCALDVLADQSSIDNCRGSIYHVAGIPAIVINRVASLFQDKVAPWLMGNDLDKAKRWLNGRPYLFPKFTYSVCDTVSSVRELVEQHTNFQLVSCDIETGKKFISSISFTCLATSGRLHTWVIPFVCPLKTDGCWWEKEKDEAIVWGLVREFLDRPMPKVFQNGSYDCAWLIRYRCPPRNVLLDTQHMWHCIWTEARKALEVISSVCCDNYRYWKNESKDAEDTTKFTRIPKTSEGYARYLRYNGLDTYYTMLCALYLLRLFKQETYDWALANYVDEIELQYGPYFAMSMRGLQIHPERQMWYYEKWQTESDKALADLRIMADDDTFNPNSSLEVGSLLFDVLGAKSPKVGGRKFQDDKGKQKRSVDEKVLKFVKLQNPLVSRVIQQIWDVKKPLNNISKYGPQHWKDSGGKKVLKGLKTTNGRLMYTVSLTTETGRTASKGNAFWQGTNGQNIPAIYRDMFIADEGYYLFDADYSQSDAYFVAFYSEDEQYMQNVLDDRDTHSVHASFFFQEPYDKVVAAKKANDPWAVDPIKGVRQQSKRITHGANYRMRGGTLYFTMGHEAVVATAINMGYRDAYNWTMAKCKAFCQELVDRYMSELYPGLPPWFVRAIEEAIQNKNKAVVYGGRTRLFFGDIRSDEDVQRELTSYYGQGGTAGNINRTCKEAFYSELELGAIREGLKFNDNFRLHLQVHDSIIGMVRIGHLHLLDKFLTIMKKPVTILGRTFDIPVECDIGFCWGKNGLVSYEPGIPEEELLSKIKQVNDKVNDKFRVAA